VIPVTARGIMMDMLTGVGGSWNKKTAQIKAASLKGFWTRGYLLPSCQYQWKNMIAFTGKR